MSMKLEPETEPTCISVFNETNDAISVTLRHTQGGSENYDHYKIKPALWNALFDNPNKPLSDSDVKMLLRQQHIKPTNPIIDNIQHPATIGILGGIDNKTGIDHRSIEKMSFNPGLALAENDENPVTYIDCGSPSNNEEENRWVQGFKLGEFLSAKKADGSGLNDKELLELRNAFNQRFGLNNFTVLADLEGDEDAHAAKALAL